MDQVQEVKEKTDIVSLIGERVNLKKAGSNYKGLCPFHNEKSPSFMVSPELQMFKCFGCQKSGDVFTFLEEYEGMEFYEALKSLADKAGVKLKTFEGGKRGFKDRFYEVNSLVSNFYHYVLTKHKAGKNALDYLLKSRKLKAETIKRFRLGYSPNVPLALKNYVVERKKVALKELSDVGVTYATNGRYFDRFRGRVIFPLSDHRGNVVGFSGRLMPVDAKKDLAKYINSPETLIYKKSQLLYGLNETRSEIKKSGLAVVVEGELDMISSYQAGIKNVVAIKGSALTEEQARLLSRFTKVVILALDADFAGNEAAKRGIFIAEREGLQVKVAELKGFKDPDEAAQKDPKKLKAFLDSAVNVWDFLVEFTFSKYKKLDGLHKEKIGQELVPILSQIENKITQSHYISLVANRLGVPIDAVMGEMKKLRFEPKKTVEIAKRVEIKEKTRREALEERLLMLVFKSDLTILKSSKIKDLFETTFAQKIVKELEKAPNNVKISGFATNIPPELKERFSDLVLRDVEGFEEVTPDKLKKEFESVKKEIQILDTKNKLEKVAVEIGEYERLKEKSKLKKAEKEFSVLSGTLSRLRSES